MGVIAGFTTLAVLLALKRPIWQVLLASSIIMGIISMGIEGLVNTLVTTASSSIAIDLVIITFLIAILVNLYSLTGFLKSLSQELIRAIRKPKLILMFVPAILGLLPVAGGALMSAPIVDGVGDYLRLEKRVKLFINVWFRHVIFLVYPLSTVLITTAALAGISIWSLIAVEFPVLIAMIVSGYVVGFRSVKSEVKLKLEGPNLNLLIRAFSPILVAIIIAVTLRSYVDGILPIPLTRLSMVLGLTVAITLILKISGAGLKGLVKAMASRNTAELTIAAFSAILLRNVFIASGGPDILSLVIKPHNTFEVILLLTLVPALLSLATGSSMTGNVVSLSIFKSLLNVGLRETMLIYSSAMLGYLASPAHLCYVYSAQYLNTPMSNSYRDMLLATIPTLAVAIITYLLWPY